MQITKNFRSREFRCKCCGVIKYDKELVDKLQILRNLIGGPIEVNSGYRCIKYNARVGGIKNSHHTTGKAADIRPGRGNLSELNRLAKLVFHDHGVGDYNTFVHVDVGNFIRFKG